ncbi:MAG: serine hydrolase domain-containing protein [Cellulosilyticaceae bacterium]
MHQERISAYFDKQKKFSGIVLVAKGQDVVGMYTAGYADSLENQPITEETQFLVPGISKLFVVLSIISLIRNGELRKEDLIKKYVPHIDNGVGINIQHLLNHTSGIVDFTKCQKEIDCYTEQEAWHIAKLMMEKKGRFEPGKKCQESETDYLILAEIIGVVAGVTYEEYVKQEIIGPLKLGNTCFMSDYPVNLAKPHNKGIVGEMMHSSVLMGWSDVVTTAEDLWKLQQALDKGEFVPYRLIEEMESPIGKNKCGDGFVVDDLWKEKCVYLSGVTEGGYMSYMARYKTSKYTTILLSNEVGKVDLQEVEQSMMEKVRNEKLSLLKKIIKQ